MFTLVAKYQKARTRDRNGNEFARFVDVRNSVGDILYYPFRLGSGLLISGLTGRLMSW